MVSARMKPFSKSVWITPAACGEVGDQAQQLIAFADEPVQARLGKAKLGEIDPPLVRRQLGKLGLDLGGDDHATGALSPGTLFDAPRMRVAGGSRRLIDIAHIEDWLGGQQIESLEGGAFLV